MKSMAATSAIFALIYNRFQTRWARRHFASPRLHCSAETGYVVLGSLEFTAIFYVF
jgi:hypothetical protein